MNRIERPDVMDEAEAIAEEWDLPIEIVIKLAIALGLPVVRDILESSDIEDVLEEYGLNGEDREE